MLVLHLYLHTTYCVVHAFPFNLDKKDQYWDAYSKFKYLTHTFLICGTVVFCLLNNFSELDRFSEKL